MTTTLNATTSNGLVTTPDNSGAIALQNAGVTGLNVSATGQVTMPLQVCYSAYMNGGYTNAVIVYGNPYVNIGAAYNTSTGVFTAPVAGVYEFYASAYANGGAMTIQLNVNGTCKAISKVNATQFTAVVHLIYTLAVGDYVTAGAGLGVQAYGDSNGYAIFTGRLIQ
jgi:hypothetical protein